ncbi:MAG TPA: 50S ribosomal protein L6 [archaeon]|nr:50S ribosomal protein L6 [archaeon]
MSRAISEERVIDIPEGIEATVDGRTVKIRGPQGELERNFSSAPITIIKKNDKIIVETFWPRKKEAAIVGAVSTHIKNMITGVTKGFTYKLKIIFAHFPASVKTDGKNVLIENFSGEKHPRVAKIVGDVRVTIKEDDILIQGINLEDVSQTATNIERATKIKNKDPRVFLDGIYVYEKGRGM